VLFEGSMRPGKGRAIKRITESLKSPRLPAVVALATPTEREKTNGISSATSPICLPPARWCCSIAVVYQRRRRARDGLLHRAQYQEFMQSCLRSSSACCCVPALLRFKYCFSVSDAEHELPLQDRMNRLHQALEDQPHGSGIAQALLFRLFPRQRRNVRPSRTPSSRRGSWSTQRIKSARAERDPASALDDPLQRSHARALITAPLGHIEICPPPYPGAEFHSPGLQIVEQWNSGQWNSGQSKEQEQRSGNRRRGDRGTQERGGKFLSRDP